jgi:hypothetical protein
LQYREMHDYDRFHLIVGSVLGLKSNIGVSI